MKAQELKIYDKNIKQYFNDILEYGKFKFSSYLNDEIYIKIQYSGWCQKNINKYEIQIWKDECGCIYNQMKKYPNIKDAILNTICYIKYNK